MSEFDYQEPLALVIISSISIGIAAIFAGWLALDIILRRGWRSMMLIMIPVYVINALYLWPITLWAYVKYGRPPKPGSGNQGHCHDKMGASDGQMTHQQEDDNKETEDTSEDLNASQHAGDQHHAPNDEEKAAEAPAEGHAHMYHGSSDRPMFATVTIGVCHCGAGCVLGDIVGEWIVYGAGVSIGDPPRELWVNYLLDFAFAFAFGIVFQYFSIAPMAGEYGPKILIRALKADALSLLFFEVGLFSWMAAFQIGIFQWRLPMNTVTYWWMMQIGMFIGHWTGVPINWWLITKGIKEPCA